MDTNTRAFSQHFVILLNPPWIKWENVDYMGVDNVELT